MKTRHNKKNFHIPFDISTFTDTDNNFLKIFSFERIKLTQTQVEQLAQLLIKYINNIMPHLNLIGKVKLDLNLSLKATAVFKKQQATRIPRQLQKEYNI